MQPVSLFDSYYFREATVEEFGPFFTENRPKIFNDSITMTDADWITDEDKHKRMGLLSSVKDRYFLRIFIMKDEEIIGWHVGRQIDEDLYHMSNTAIFDEYRGKGIYSALLPKLLEIFKEKGFQKVSSRHLASNGAVLVPKLKAGFVITGFEIDERYGILVVLSYIFNERRLKAYKFRTGALRLDGDMKKYLLS
jgi:GNAT superfamily N-acetyltransferase